MGGEWTRIKLGEILDVKHGFAFKGEYFRDEPPGDVLLTPGNFAIGGGFKGDKLKYYVGPVPEEFVLQEGDLLVTMTDLSKSGDTLGYPAIVPSSSGQYRFLHNQRLGKISMRDKRKAHPRFVFYLLCSHRYRHEIVAGATGTTVKHTSPSRIMQFETSIPPLKEQQAIACILGALDDKIELNRRMNRTLEAMARAIFKSWFVDFLPVRAKQRARTQTGDPVRAKAEGRKPNLPKKIADLFPDEFEESEMGEIPRGWRVGKLGDISENPRRGISATDIAPSTPYIALEHMPRHSIALADWEPNAKVESNKFQFQKGDILFGKLRPYFHKVGIAPVDGICSTDVLVVTPKSQDWFGFTLGHFSSDALVQHANASSTGTKMPRTNWGDLARFQVALPEATIAREFNTRIQPMVSRLHAGIHESRTLAALRDALLPKLISGELRVPDAERIVGRAV